MRNLFAMSVVACALSSAANAEIIHFTNPAQGEPGHYDWRFSLRTSLTDAHRARVGVRNGSGRPH